MLNLQLIVAEGKFYFSDTYAVLDIFQYEVYML